MVALILSVSATGCGSGDENTETLSGVGDASASADPAPTTAASPQDSGVPDGVPTEVPSEPTGLDDNDAGAKAYAEYVFGAFWVNFFRNDVAALRDLGRCPGCTTSIETMKRLKADDQFQIPDEFPVPLFTSKINTIGAATVVGISFDLSDGTLVDADGTEVDTIKGQKKKYMEVAVKWEGGQWQLEDLAITD